jgi:hypothetical protein
MDTGTELNIFGPERDKVKKTLKIYNGELRFEKGFIYTSLRYSK